MRDMSDGNVVPRADWETDRNSAWRDYEAALNASSTAYSSGDRVSSEEWDQRAARIIAVIRHNKWDCK